MFASNRSRAVLVQFLDGQLRLDPRNIDLLVQRAEAENIPASGFHFGSSEKALELIEVPLKMSPNHGRALLVRGLLRLDFVGDGSEALAKQGYEDLDKAIAAGAGNATAFSRRSIHRVQENNYAGAVADLTAAIKLTPDDVTLYSQRADSLEKLERWSEAIADHSKCVALEPGKANRLADRAEAYAGARQWQKSLADYAAAITLSPKDADLYLGRAATHRLSGNREAALLDHKRARALDPLLPELKADFSNAAEIEALRHDLKHAFARMSKATDDVTAAAAEMLKAKRQMERAEARLRRQIVGDDRSPEQILKDFDEASEGGQLDAQDWRERAGALLKLKRLDEALNALDQSILLQDDHAGVRDQRGRLHEAKRNFDAAFADYDRAIELSPKTAEFRLDRGDIWWERKDFAKAHADYAEAVALDPKDGGNWYKRGNALFKLGRFAEAVADYDKALELKPDLENARKNREIARSRLSGG
jgi:tetratricopeptide (TPR) repeat protein